ncbi:MAG: hypothetical protein AABX84_01650 [Nanoarchaeota archaeon]
MAFNLSDDLVKAHLEVKDLDTLSSNYLLTLNDGTTFNIMGGKARRIRIGDRRAILEYEKADDVRKLQSLNLDDIVLLNGEFVPLEDAYRSIRTDYVPCAKYIGVDDSDEIRTELLMGRGRICKQFEILNSERRRNTA